MANKQIKSERKIFFKGDQDTQLAESLRVLRTNIHFMEEKGNRVVVFTSTIPKEGKSTVAANYAMSVAISGEKVLLVDCDIRRPRAHSSFGIRIDHGMGSILMGDKAPEDVILKNVEENLDILPSKHISQNVTELFLGSKMKNLLKELRKQYDLIVLDTPPLAVATDAVILSEYSDGVVYVCGYDMVSKKELLNAKKMLDRAKANIYGIVVNKIDKRGYSYGNYGYYNNYYSYYEEYIKGEK
ncbi:MAG: CpsD/CapB family tyrosine-protein kinase [Psychrilyobacter sp.]|uniref:CpsD/CapB family tyrosine-protein kinase n=1 Tax=Psychrilyobacter sp. TaxID=2586924 RepID=UPI003C7961FB